MQKKKLSVKEFNFILKRARYDKDLFEVLYKYCTEIIREHVIYKYGRNNFFSNVPHDAFTRFYFDYPPKKFVTSPTSYLCSCARKFMYDMYNIKDNQTLVLYDDYPYFPEYENNIEFLNLEFELKWRKLDKLTRYILYMNIFLGYKLTEIAKILNLRADYVRLKKSRAKKIFKSTE